MPWEKFFSASKEFKIFFRLLIFIIFINNSLDIGLVILVRGLTFPEVTRVDNYSKILPFTPKNIESAISDDHSYSSVAIGQKF